MEVIHERCVGLDVHKETVVGCVRVMEQLEQTVREFEAQIEAALEPFRAAVERLMTIPASARQPRP